ncbi:MAG: hypothetical protein JWR04_3301 [Rhodoglobus sp.]|nr:hypothetical protein [Rhodoglobus sp.]
MKRPLVFGAAALFIGALVLTAPLAASATGDPPVVSLNAVVLSDDHTATMPFAGGSISDPDGDSLDLTITWPVANGTLTGGDFVIGSGSATLTGIGSYLTTQLGLLTFTPTIGLTATSPLTTTVTDGTNPAVTSVVSVTVSALTSDLHIGASGTAAYGSAATVSPVYPAGMAGVDTSGVLCVSSTALTDPVATYATAGLCSGAVAQPGFNYNFIYDAGAVVIGKALITITASSDSGVYGALPAVVPLFLPLPNNETSVPGITCTTVAPVVPSAPTRCAGTAANYAPTFVDGTMTISPAPLVITPSNAQSTYGGAAPVTAAYSGFISPDTKTVLTTQPTCTTSAGATAHVGGYPATTSCAGAVATNYVITYGASGTTTITPAPLAITALGKSRLQGQANGDFTATATGFVNGQTLANLSGTLAFTTAAGVTSGPGSYPVQPSGVSSTDYAITFLPGVVTVTAVNPTPTPTPTPTVTPTHTPTPTPTPTPTRTSSPTPTPDPMPNSGTGDLAWLPWVIGAAAVVFIAAAIAVIAWRRRV